jgi:hypothetical protein
VRKNFIIRGSELLKVRHLVEGYLAPSHKYIIPQISLPISWFLKGILPKCATLFLIVFFQKAIFCVNSLAANILPWAAEAISFCLMRCFKIGL